MREVGELLGWTWKDQRAEMLKSLRLGTRRDKKKRTKQLLDISDEVRDLHLREYYLLCKRKAAWRRPCVACVAIAIKAATIVAIGSALWN